MTAKLKWAAKHGVFLVVSTDGSVEDKDWDALLDALRRAEVKAYVGLVIGSTAANPAQRRLMFDLLKEKSLLAIVVTDSSVTRGFVTIASWVGVKAKAYAHENIDRAVTDLGLDASKSADLVRMMREMRNDVTGASADQRAVAR